MYLINLSYFVQNIVKKIHSINIYINQLDTLSITNSYIKKFDMHYIGNQTVPGKKKTHN